MSVELRGMKISRETPGSSHSGYTILAALTVTAVLLAWIAFGFALPHGAIALFLGAIIFAGLAILILACGFFMI